MDQNVDTPADALIGQFLALGRLRVWSVIITIFGDLATRPGASIPAADLVRLTGRMGIRADAFRVAVHRLKNDGWLTSVRQGRNSLYSLTDAGFSQCHDARPRIYASAPPDRDRVRILLAPPLDASALAQLGDAMREAGFQPVTPRLFVGTGQPDVAPDMLALAPTGGPVPDWLRNQLGPADLVAGFARLETALLALREALGSGLGFSADDSVVLRVLTIHRWRQLILRSPDLPTEFFPVDWRAEPCRRLVHEILAALPPARPLTDQNKGPHSRSQWGKT